VLVLRHIGGMMAVGLSGIVPRHEALFSILSRKRSMRQT